MEEEEDKKVNNCVACAEKMEQIKNMEAGKISSFDKIKSLTSQLEAQNTELDKAKKENTAFLNKENLKKDGVKEEHSDKILSLYPNFLELDENEKTKIKSFLPNLFNADKNIITSGSSDDNIEKNDDNSIVGHYEYKDGKYVKE